MTRAPEVGALVRVKAFQFWRGPDHWPVGTIERVGPKRALVRYKTPRGKSLIRSRWFPFADIREVT